MKRIMMISLFASVMFAGASFETNKQYTCLNTHNIQQGQEVKVNPNEAKKKPFVFTINDNKLVSTDNVVFDFKMQRGTMSSYSNAHYMLLLTQGMQLGLVPRKSQGAAQFYFQCQ